MHYALQSSPSFIDSEEEEEEKKTLQKSARNSVLLILNINISIKRSSTDYKKLRNREKRCNFAHIFLELWPSFARPDISFTFHRIGRFKKDQRISLRF